MKTIGEQIIFFRVNQLFLLEIIIFALRFLCDKKVENYSSVN